MIVEPSANEFRKAKINSEWAMRIVGNRAFDHSRGYDIAPVAIAGRRWLRLAHG
jgi:hypothetical protein